MYKTFLIVGGTTGIGKALTDTLLGSGHVVFVASRNATERIDGTAALHVHNIDATREDADWSFLPEKIHGVAYLGGSINLKPFHRLKNEDFLEDFKVNTLGAVNTIQAALPKLKEAGGGAIVLFSSVAVQRGLTFHASVSAAKGGIEGLTKALSAELAPAIRVNAIALSLSDTPMAEKLLNTDAKKESSKNRHALKKVGTPYDGAAMAGFLLSDQATWITGQIIGVDGGMGAIQNL